MTKEFIKLRLDMALEMLENIHADLCNESIEGENRESTNELGQLVCQMRTFVKTFNEQKIK